MTTRSYSGMSKLESFEDRYNYLKLNGRVGDQTFGGRRYLNQEFYHSDEWLSVRDKVIIRDDGCDLGIEGRDIEGPILVHHMIPITDDDIIEMRPHVLDMNNLVCVSLQTHNAIHYGDESLLLRLPPERFPGDTKLW